MKETAKRAAVATLVVIALVAAALALWKLKLVLALVFLGIIIAAAMRPGIEWLRRHRVPRGIALLDTQLSGQQGAAYYRVGSVPQRRECNPGSLAGEQCIVRVLKD